MMMIWLAYLALFLVFVGISVVYSVPLCILWSAALREEATAVEKSNIRGLTKEDLERLEEGKIGAGGGGECVVCLEEMEEGQAARVLPSCRHFFHRPCADAWLQIHPACPLCRADQLLPPSLPQSQHQSQPQSPS